MLHLHLVLLLCELNRLLVVEEVGEEEDVGDDVDEVEDDEDVGVVALGDVVGVVGQEEEGGEEAQQEDLVGQSLEGDRVLNLGQTWRTTQRAFTNNCSLHSEHGQTPLSCLPGGWGRGCCPGSGRSGASCRSSAPASISS